MNTEKTIRAAVTQAVKRESDHWASYLVEGVLLDAVVKNRIGGPRGESLRDYRVMRMATKYGRAFQGA